MRSMPKYKGQDLSVGLTLWSMKKTTPLTLTEAGLRKMPNLIGVPEYLTSDLSGEWAHHIIQAIKAHDLFERDVDYVVKDGKVIIVDEFTGRLMPGRRWSDGMHQAVEAKENCRLRRKIRRWQRSRYRIILGFIRNWPV